jgi:DNA-binding transcriptional ArsR family regulator
MTNISPLDALGDPTRRQLFEYLRLGPCPVTELISIVPISQPAVSQHLRVLREARLVRVEKRGQQRIYHLNPVGLAELRQYVESFWDDVLRAFGEAAEQMANTAPVVESKPTEKKPGKRAK